MLRTLLGHRRKGVVTSLLAVAVTVPLTLALSGAFAASSSPTQTAVLRQQAAQHLIKIGAARYMTWPAQLALHFQATGDRQLSPLSLAGSLAQPVTGGSQAAELPVPSANLANVRVNNPGEDTHAVGQTTQSETAIAVAGSHVAVGFNDSAIAGLRLIAGTNLNGYAYSTNGGQSFTDGGALPGTPGTVNFGDPWMGSDRTGAMYYSTLVLNFFTGNLEVGVAKSTDGGKTWSTPVPVFQPPSTLFNSGDKDAMAVGPDPAVKTRDDVYVAYDDSSFDTVTNTAFNGLPVAHSTDGGKTWKLVYAAKFVQSMTGCSFKQVIGATPLVAADGTLYVTAEQIAVNDPKCTGAPTVLSEVFFKSTDGGNTFSKAVTIANVTAAEPNGLLFLGPGRYARTIEFPSPAVSGGKIYVAWNDGGLGGHSHLRLATSANGGATWTNSFVTGGSGDDVQPSLSADSSGLHLLYYHRHTNNTLDVYVTNSTNGTTFTARRVTSVAFPGSLTLPQFDPIIADAYMGDYIANVSAGSHLYFAWGDNRDIVKDFLFPNGRNDPDVFFARN